MVIIAAVNAVIVAGNLATLRRAAHIFAICHEYAHVRITRIIATIYVADALIAESLAKRTQETTTAHLAND